ncbi:MAG: hypothetical protein JWM74_1782 [Myxococcaceae bacterium]|nr:hypothetical protein [Myxococcaceae bacterium]
MSGMKRVNLGLVGILSLLSLASAACGGSTPPPKPPEEAIDTQSSPAGKSTNPNTASDDTSASPASTTDTSAANANSAADPSAALTAPAGTTTAPAGKSGKGKGGKEAATPPPPPPAGKTGPIISAADCSKLTDKYVELVISGEGAPLRGTSGKELEQAREMVKASAASDPNFINMQKQCVKEIHRSQYTCGMNARSAAEWQDCIR